MDNFDRMIKDTDHWHGLLPPMAPNAEEVALYRKFIGESRPVYLLGMTKDLLDLCDVAVDLNPVPTTKSVLLANWLEMDGFQAGVVIGDGVLNLAGMELVERVSKLSKKLICRVFLKRQPWMKYATHFPKSFPGATITQTQPEIAMVVWSFG